MLDFFKSNTWIVAAYILFFQCILVFAIPWGYIEVRSSDVVFSGFTSKNLRGLPYIRAFIEDGRQEDFFIVGNSVLHEDIKKIKPGEMLRIKYFYKGGIWRQQYIFEGCYVGRPYKKFEFNESLVLKKISEIKYTVDSFFMLIIFFPLTAFLLYIMKDDFK